MFNNATIIGNLTRDIELRYTQAGTAIGSTGIAATRKFTVNGEKREEVCFIDITFFGKSAEVANQYLRKGSKLMVNGRIVFDTWVDQNGGKRSKHSITVETMEMLDCKDRNTGGNQYAQQGQQQAPQYQQYQQPQQQYQQPQQVPQYQQPQQAQEQQQAPQYQQPQQAQAQAHQMPAQEQIPEIDIDNEEIPF